MSTAPPTYVLVPGAWCGPWAWDELTPHLDGTVVAVDLPSAGTDPSILGDLSADVAAVRAAVDAADGPVILCGHSYGGMPITELADHPAIAHAVYLTAFFPPPGVSMMMMLQELPDWLIDRGDGSLAVTDDPVRAREVMSLDIDEERFKELHGQLRLQSRSSFEQPSTGRAHGHPVTYVICEQDGAIPLPAQEQMSQQADQVIRLDSAHFPQQSMPDRVAEVLNELAHATI
jgi:pimeloyl-ACP methyl ester carboxylesterase